LNEKQKQFKVVKFFLKWTAIVHNIQKYLGFMFLIGMILLGFFFYLFWKSKQKQNG
jgi:hypothetical protein